MPRRTEGENKSLIVYLDTSFLSEFAKVESVKHGRSARSNRWRNLLAVLRRGVQQGTLLCPASEFQLQEALLSPQLVPEFTRIQAELSGGYFFRDWRDILVQQTADHLVRFLGKQRPASPGWTPLCMSMPSVPPPEVTREVKQGVYEHAKMLREQGKRTSSFPSQYKRERISFVRQTTLQAAAELHAITATSIRADLAMAPSLGFFDQLLRTADVADHEEQQVLTFLLSDSVDQIPFIYTFCSVFASLRHYEPSRQPKPSDVMDVPALATVIEYSDIITTDKNLKAHAVDRLKLDKRYNARFFSATADDLDVLTREVSDETSGPEAP